MSLPHNGSIVTMSQYDWETGATTYNLPAMDAAQRFRCAISQATEAARKRFPHSLDRIERAYALVSEGKVVLHPRTKTATVTSSDGSKAYTVNGTCECPDAARAPEQFCKHRLAVLVLKKAVELVETWKTATAPVTVQAQALTPEETQDAGAEAPGVPVVPSEVGDVPSDTPPGADAAGSVPEAENAPTIPAQFLYRAKGGKTAVYYAGLLDLAHRQGLIDLNAEFISVTSELALAKATATFRDGRTFSEAADATPGNVGKAMGPHFARLALTRAKARCLRDALNVHHVTVEELDE